MAPRRAEEVPTKRIAALGCKLPAQLPAGEILTDITQNKWKLGNIIGHGGFGDIYLASNDIYSTVDEDAKYVIKVEPHNNGPLFVERNFYIRVARKRMITDWCKLKGRKRIGIPTYEGSGSHKYKDSRYRFLVIPRYGIDIGKLFLASDRKLPTKLINSLAVQMLDVLEYIHSKGYAHADVKGSNILLKSHDYKIGKERTQAYLVDYGLAYLFRTSAGKHKPFLHDERRAHEGTLEFTSRDAHHGTHSRRGDLETLGYNLLQWICGKLPWEKEDGGNSIMQDPEKVHEQKELFFSNIPQYIQKYFASKRKPPATIIEYFQYIEELGFETKPNYSYLKNLFQSGSCQESNVPKFLLKFTESNENLSCAKSINKPCLRERRPCKPVNGELRITRNTHPVVVEKSDFSWEAVLSRHPDKLAKISVQSPPSSPLTPPPSPPPPSIPTYAMLNVLQRIKERQSGVYKQKISSKHLDDSKAKYMTPAMEEIALLKKKESKSSDNSNNNNSRRITRSRAQLKRKSEVSSLPEVEFISSINKSALKKRKISSS